MVTRILVSSIDSYPTVTPLGIIHNKRFVTYYGDYVRVCCEVTYIRVTKPGTAIFKINVWKLL